MAALDPVCAVVWKGVGTPVRWVHAVTLSWGGARAAAEKVAAVEAFVAELRRRLLARAHHEILTITYWDAVPADGVGPPPDAPAE